ncbi:MAG: hypothetical protein DRN17_00445 [Thermoplasmata archaeon]|nr:MAG: hypothetical protein DRN17_00445 [Thermoplasmata archaeon]
MDEKGVETRVRDGKEEISFKVSAMPKEHFLRFKHFADEEWGGSYWHSIKFLLDFYEMSIMGLVNQTQEDKQTQRTKKTLGGEMNE